jgi:DNA-binding NtrC family response regulator
MEDLPALWEQFSRQYGSHYGVAPKGLADDALEVLATYGWPGNIIELKNLIERLTLIDTGPVIAAAAIPLDFHIGGWRRGLSYRDAMEHMERQFFLRLLLRSGGCRRRVAERLGLSYSTLKFRLRKLQLSGSTGDSTLM